MSILRKFTHKLNSFAELIAYTGRDSDPQDFKNFKPPRARDDSDDEETDSEGYCTDDEATAEAAVEEIKESNKREREEELESNEVKKQKQ